MVGRKPIPQHIRLLKNDKAHAHLYVEKDKNEPVPSSNCAVAPEDMSPDAKRYFEEFVDRVQEMYPCSSTDEYSITLYANNHEQLVYLESFLRVNGVTFTYEDKFGNEVFKKRPEVDIHKQCKDFELRILVEYGLTPSSRARVPLKPKQTKANSFADLDEING